MNYILLTLETFFIILIAELPYLLIIIGVGYLLVRIFEKQFNKFMNMLFDETDKVERQL